MRLYWKNREPDDLLQHSPLPEKKSYKIISRTSTLHMHHTPTPIAIRFLAPIEKPRTIKVSIIIYF